MYSHMTYLVLTCYSHLSGMSSLDNKCQHTSTGITCYILIILKLQYIFTFLYVFISVESSKFKLRHRILDMMVHVGEKPLNIEAQS